MRDVDEIRSLMSPADPAAGVDVGREATAQDLIDRAAEPVTEPVGTPEPVRRHRVRRRLAWSAMGATAVAAAIVAAVVVPGLRGPAVKPAYAVTVQHDGKVRVEIRELTDAAGFQRTMQRAGVPTEVEKVPEGMMCKVDGGPHRYDAISYRLHRVSRNKALATAVIIDPEKIGRHQALIVETAGTRVTLFYVAKSPHRCVPVR